MAQTNGRPREGTLIPYPAAEPRSGAGAVGRTNAGQPRPGKVSDSLRLCHFFIPVHQRLYEAILKLAERSQMPGLVTLKHYFEKDDDLKHVGGTEYLAAVVITIINAEDYSRTIYDLYRCHELIALCQEVLRYA
jgi:replicative DNA helicase